MSSASRNSRVNCLTSMDFALDFSSSVFIKEVVMNRILLPWYFIQVSKPTFRVEDVGLILGI